MLDWKLIVSPSFWFSLHWNPLTFETAMLMTGIFSACAVAGVVLFWVAEKKKKTDPLTQSGLQRVAVPIFLAGLAGDLFTFFAYQQIPIFAARFWFLAIFLVFLAAEIPAIRFLLVTVPKRRAQQGARAQWSQYFKR